MIKKSNGPAVVAWRQRTKLRLLALMGGKCKTCGYKKSPGALHFHHLDPSTKEFAIGATGIPRSWDRTKAEAEKCILLCANCHKKLHARTPHVIKAEGKLIDTCVKHGNVPFYSYRKRNKIVHTCAYCMLESQRARRWKLKSELVESLGGKCSRCNEDDIESLEFHHLHGKRDTIASLMNNPSRARLEAKKCIILCSNCHHEEHHPVLDDIV